MRKKLFVFCNVVPKIFVHIDSIKTAGYLFYSRLFPAVDVYRRIMNIEKLKNIIIDKINSIPTIPHVLRRLIPLLQNENVPIDDIQQIISMDIAISSRLLKVANSAYYGLMKQVTSVRQALHVLGMRQVKSLALGIAVLETMKRVSGRQTLDFRDLWLHSIGCGIASTMLCELAGGLDRESTFTVAMLHDMGKIPLNGLFPDDYARVIECRDRGRSLSEAEREVFGIDHGDVGGWLCDIWKFPSFLSEPIQGHHNPLPSSSLTSLLTATVVVADFLSRRAGIGHGGNTHDTMLPEQACTLLHIQPDMLDDLQKRVAVKKSQATAFFEATQ